MVYKKDTTLGQTRDFEAQIQVLDCPNDPKVGYFLIGFVRRDRAACRLPALKWKMGNVTGGKKMEEPHALKSNEFAQCYFQPQQPSAPASPVWHPAAKLDWVVAGQQL